MARAKSEDKAEIQIVQLNAVSQPICILGTSPLIFNRMALKARQTLLFPAPRKSKAERDVTQKHDPMEEYRNSVNKRRPEEKGPTRLVFPSPAFKGAMATAALDMPSVTKAKINRLTWVEGYSVDIYGVPQMFMSVVRTADQNKTPDIRTRAILPQWAARIVVRYVEPLIKIQPIVTLLGASGLICGVGDFRQEKGKGSFGQFEVCNEDEPQYQQILKVGGTIAQDAALEDPDFFDQDTEDLYTWFVGEKRRREEEPTIIRNVRKRRTQEPAEATA